MITKSREIIRSSLRIIDKHPYHWHDKLTIIMVVKGVVRVRAWGRDDLMQQGDILVVNVGELHQLERVSDDNLVVITFIDRGYCNNEIKEFEDMVISFNSMRYEQYHPHKYLVFRRLYKDLLCALVFNENTINDQVIICTNKLLRYLVMHFDYISGGINLKRFSKKIISRNREIYRKVVKIDGIYADYSIKDIAKLLNINYSHLRSDIVKRYGYGYKFLKHSVMVEHAAKLMLSTDDSITSICFTCGFSDAKYMIKYFKTFYECTPSVFRSTYSSRSPQIQEISINSVELCCEKIFRL